MLLTALLPLLVVTALAGVFLVPQWLNKTGLSDHPAASANKTGGPSARTAAATAKAPVNPTPSAGALPATPGREGSGNSASACPLPGGVLTVAASPDIAGAVSKAAAEPLTGSVESAATSVGSSATSVGSAATSVGSTTASCRITVTAAEPADVLSALQSDPGHRPDVWIPDASIWLTRAARAGVPMPARSPSLASSPVVFALSASAAARLAPAGSSPTLAQLLATRLTASPIRLGLPDPQRSAASVYDLLAVQAQIAGRPQDRSALTWAVESSPVGLPTQGAALLSRLSSDPATALPVTEQAVWTYNGRSARAVAVYPNSGGFGLDYPYSVMAPARSPAGAFAAELLARLHSATGRNSFSSSGFRNPEGDPLTTTAGGVGSAARGGVTPPTPAAVDSILHSVAVLQEPSRLLAVIDISGSMISQVPAAGGATRLDLAKSAAELGLALYPSDSEVGLWVFSKNLPPSGADYRQLVPVGPLTALVGGLSGAQRVGQGIAGAQVNPNGGTALYDTTLAAVRSMRAHWDPARVNAVLILSDGQNDDDNSISLTGLLTTLKNEQDAARPVPVITIGLGPDSDTAALSQISSATGGAAYVARDPRNIGGIFLDAVGQRLCRPHC